MRRGLELERAPRQGAAQSPTGSAPRLGFRLSYDANCQIKS
jgi:hypothetical protein